MIFCPPPSHTNSTLSYTSLLKASILYRYTSLVLQFAIVSHVTPFCQIVKEALQLSLPLSVWGHRHQEKTKMDQVSLSNFVSVAFMCYFGFIIYKSNTKLTEGNIGTIFRRINHKTVQERSIIIQLCFCLYLLNETFQYPPITVCMYRNMYWDYDTDKWESDESDQITYMNEFPKSARKDLFRIVEYSRRAIG